MSQLRAVFASAIAATISIWFSVAITIWAEFSAPTKNWLKNFSGHHWTSKSIFSVAVFIVFFLIFFFWSSLYRDDRVKKSLDVLFGSLILGTITLLLFFAAHYWQIF